MHGQKEQGFPGWGVVEVEGVELLFHGYRAPVWDDEKILQMGGCGCLHDIVNVPNRSLN